LNVGKIMRFAYTLVAAWAAIVFGAALFITGLSQPKALLGCILLAAYFGFYAAQGFAFERKKKLPPFRAEADRILQTLKIGSDVAPAIAALSPTYHVVSEAQGLSLCGLCRGTDLRGEVVDIRVSAKAGKVVSVRCRPKRNQKWNEVVFTLGSELPRDRTPRDWMGNPIDRR
jgi:hypothetical protein